MHYQAGKRPWFILGAGGHGAAVAEVLHALDATILGFVDARRVDEGHRLGIEILATLPAGHLQQGNPVALAVGDNFQRQVLSRAMQGQGAQARNFPPIAHPSASVSRFAEIDHGTVILQGASVGAAAQVGQFCAVATGAVLTHDAVMKDYSFVSSNAVLGAAMLGERAFVGMGAVVGPGSMVGDDSVIGARSLVRGQVRSQVVAYGVPATEIRERSVGEAYLS